VIVGSAWLSRPGWLHDHGCNAPFYGGDGKLADWIPCGVRLQVTGPITTINECQIAPTGPPGGFCWPAWSQGQVYPVAWPNKPFPGFVSIVDVTQG
jgi:hypothetical protein